MLKVAVAILRIALIGAGFGMLMVVWGTMWQGYSGKEELKNELLSGMIGGATAGLVLHLTRRYRAKGEAQYYCSWMLTGVTAALIIVAPALLTDGLTAIILAVVLGAGGGLGLAIFARQVSSNH